MANVTTLTKKVPRHAYYRQVAAQMPPHGATLRDQILAVEINRDLYDSLFDDFLGNSLHDMYTLKEDTGGTTVATSLAILASTAADNKYAGFTGGDLSWMGGKNCMMQVRCAPTAITENKFEIGFTGLVAGNGGCVNAIDNPSWTAGEDTVIFAFDTDGTNDVWQAMAYNSTAPKKRQLYNTRTSTATAATTLTDTSATSWIANSLAGQKITCTSTGYPASVGTIASNSTTVATLAGGWSNGTPATVSTYVIGNAPAALTIPVAAQYNTYTIKIEQSTALFYINGIQVAVIPAAVSATTAGLSPWLFAQARGGGTINAILNVDYLWLIQSREVTA